MSGRTTIGDVIVIRDTDGDNPYVACRDNPLPGDERAAALAAYRDGEPTPGLVFWSAPGNGGARILAGPHEVDWRGMRR
jgi:hypothetical protein